MNSAAVDDAVFLLYLHPHDSQCYYVNKARMSASCVISALLLLCVCMSFLLLQWDPLRGSHMTFRFGDRSAILLAIPTPVFNFILKTFSGVILTL